LGLYSIIHDFCRSSVYTIVDASQQNAQPTSLSNHHCPCTYNT